jgi:hypothetical protein
MPQDSSFQLGFWVSCFVYFVYMLTSMYFELVFIPVTKIWFEAEKVRIGSAQQLDEINQQYDQGDFVEDVWSPETDTSGPPIEEEPDLAFDEDGNPIFKFWTVVTDPSPPPLMSF